MLVVVGTYYLKAAEPNLEMNDEITLTALQSEARDFDEEEARAWAIELNGNIK